MFTSLYAQQKDTVNVPDFFEAGNEGTLNVAVEAAQAAGVLSQTVFKLKPWGLYVLTSTIKVNTGEHLEIVAPKPGITQATAPPQIVWTATGDVETSFNFQCYGNITLKNIWLRYANLNGAQVSSSLVMENDSLTGGQETAVFEGVIFDYAQVGANGSGAVSISSDHFKGTFKNCYFRNCIDPHFRYYGRAVSFPYETTGWHIDEILFENCTFANIGYVYMQEGGEYGDNVFFNHCTFVNTAMFTLESGWWYKMHVTNSIHQNTFMYGYRLVDITDSETGEVGDPNGATVSITAVDSMSFEVPFTDQDRHILFANNSHGNTDWLIDWMANNPHSQMLHKERRDDEIPLPQPFLNNSTMNFFDSTDADGNKGYPYMNRANNYENTLPGFIEAPTNLDGLKEWLLRKWDDDLDTNWAYDKDSGKDQIWPLPENLAYTNETLMTGAMGGFPVGDLSWWPEKYVEWEAQADQEHARITEWLETGKDPDQVSVKQIGTQLPAEYKLGQNYPNPFNPTTNIAYSVPKHSHITLKVYNNLGQEVSTIFSGNQNAGNYIATFDGTGLATGVYMYRLQSENVSISKKFILMK